MDLAAGLMNVSIFYGMFLQILFEPLDMVDAN